MGACESKAAVKQTGVQADAVAEWKANYSSSVRSSLLHRHKYPVEEDFTIHQERLMGKGGCGEVYAAERMDSDQVYAIKFCDKSKLDQTRLEREIVLLKDTDHPNIVRLFSVYETPLMTFLVMELCGGGHLGKLLISRSVHNINKMQCIDEEWAKLLCRQLLSAVCHLHERGIAHRDIKLQNILLERSGDRNAQVKLIDFGYASRFIGACPMRTVCGTPYTTAPEVFRESYDERCDVWSVGVVLFIMLSGKRPFEHLEITGGLQAAGKTVMMTNILAGRYSFNPRFWGHVSEDAKSFVKTLLHPKYQSRMSAKQAVNAPWIKVRTDLIPERVHASVNALNCARMDEGQAEGASEGWDFSNIYNRGFFSKSKAGPAPAALSPCLILTAQQTALSPKALEDMHRLSNSSKQLLNAMECSDFEATMALSLEQLAESGGAGSEIEVSTAVSNILKNHKSQHAPSTLRRTGNMALAYGLHQSQTTNIRRLFQSVDIDGSGALCTAEFTRAMILLCGPDALTEDDCSMIFNQMDINRDDQISFTEFLAGTLNPEALDIEELSKAFALLDHNGDGFISADELKKLYNFKFMKKQYPTQETASLEPMCPPTTADGAADVDPPKNCPKISREHSNDITNEMTPQPKMSKAATLDETVMQIMEQCDTDQDGRISYEEFIMAMTGGHEMLDWACVPLQGQEGDPDVSVGPHEDGMGEEEIEEEVGEESAGGRTGQVEPGAPTTLNGDCSGDAAKRPQSVHGDDSRSNSVSSTIKRGLMGIFTRSGSNSRVVPHNSDSANPAQEKGPGPGPAADQEFSEVLSTAHAACTVESKMCDDQGTGEAPGLVAGEGR